jgi:hypothetical protein
MKFNPFQLAAERAKQAIGEEEWRSLGLVEQSAAIYRELRLIDAALVSGHRFGRQGAAASHPPAQPASSRRADPVPRVRCEVDSDAA